jgi:hypothetical protein
MLHIGSIPGDRIPERDYTHKKKEKQCLRLNNFAARLILSLIF